MTGDSVYFGDATPQGLAQRAVDMFLTLVRRGTALAAGTLAVVSTICIGSFLLGLAALSDDNVTAWIVIGGIFVVIGVGAVALAIFRLWLVKRSATELVVEVQQLLVGDRQTERVVIDTIEASEKVQDQSAVVMSRQFFTLRDSIDGRGAQFIALAYALRAMTTFPFLMLVSTTVTIVFATLAVIFTGILIF
jgi:hypothetical protein